MEGMAHPRHGLGRTATDCNHLEMLGFEFPILYFSFFLESLEVSGYVPVEVHKYLFFQAGSPQKRAAVVAMRCGVPEKEPHITGHINFCFSAQTPFSLLPSCRCAIIQRQKKRERPPWTTTTTPQIPASATLKFRDATDSQSHFPPPCRGRANARVGSVVDCLSCRIPRLVWTVDSWRLRGPICLVRAVKFRGTRRPDQQQGEQKALPRPTGRVDRHPSAVLPGSTNEWRGEGAESLGRGNRAHVLFPRSLRCQPIWSRARPWNRSKQTWFPWDAMGSRP